MSVMDFVVPPPGCGRSVTDFWGWGAHRPQLRCPIMWVIIYGWAWNTRRGLKPKFYRLPRPWSLWGSSPARENSHVITGNRPRDLMVSNQKFWQPSHEAGRIANYNIRTATQLLLWGKSRCLLQELWNIMKSVQNIQSADRDLNPNLSHISTRVFLGFPGS
jgi:hypothetical protein